MRLALALCLCLSCPAATVIRQACGGPGGQDSAGNVWTPDASYAGGAAWTQINQPALAGLPIPYRTLRYSSPPGAPISYTLALIPGSYTVVLKFIEPNATAAGARVFTAAVASGTQPAVGSAGQIVTSSVSGAALPNLDLFAVAGTLGPYDVTIPITVTTGGLVVILTPTHGNAVLSGIQVDEVPEIPVPTFTRLPYMSALIPGPDLQSITTGAIHHQMVDGRCPLTVAVYEAGPPMVPIQVGWTVDPASCDVAIAFAVPQSQYYVVVK